MLQKRNISLATKFIFFSFFRFYDFFLFCLESFQTNSISFIFNFYLLFTVDVFVIMVHSQKLLINNPVNKYIYNKFLSQPHSQIYIL